MEVLSNADRIRILIEDSGSAFSRDELLPASEEEWAASGLRVLDAVASRWGTGRSANGGPSRGLR